MALRIRQGLSTDRTSITPASGELIYTTDTKFVYVGDGSTAGGNLISGAVATNLDGLSDVVITSASNGQVLKFNGSNWVNAAESGGGGGSMTDFRVTAGDSTQATILDGELLSIVGDGSATVTLDPVTKTLTIGTPYFVNPGVQGQLAFYNVTGSNLSPTPPDLIYDEINQTLYIETVHPNLLLTDNPTMAFINTDNGGFSFGGTLNGTEYPAIIGINDLIGPSIDPNNPFNILLKITHNEAPTKAFTFARSRGTLATETGVQTSDSLGSILFSAYNGSSFVLGAAISSTVELAYTPGQAVPTNLFLQTADSSGTLQTSLYCDSEQTVYFAKAYRSPPFVANVTSGNVTFTRKELTGNYLIALGTPPGPRDVIIPNPSVVMAGFRFVFRNICGQTVTLKDTSLNTISIVNNNTHIEIIYTDLDIYQLY